MRFPGITAVPRVVCVALLSSLISVHTGYAQDLVPAAYTPAPVGFNVVTVVGSLLKGDVTFDPALPVEDGHATIGGLGAGFSRTINLAGRYANVVLFVPYAKGRVEGILQGEFQETSRSGLGDVSARIGVNLYGAPAMTLKEFATYRASTIVGASLGIAMPTGQYDPGKVINLGTNRWTFKPEVGISRRRGRWTIEGDIGGGFFTENTNFLNGGRRRQAPIFTFQGHVIYTVRPGLWVAADGNFWRGGRITTNGTRSADLQHNSRLGLTLAVPVNRQQVRVALSTGAYTRLGGDFTSIGVSYSYAWTARRP